MFCANPVTIRTGDEVLFVYSAGDCDNGTVTYLMPAAVTVVRSDGKVIHGVPESIGIGVDDCVSAIYDDGTVYYAPQHEDDDGWYDGADSWARANGQ